MKGAMLFNIKEYLLNIWNHLVGQKKDVWKNSFLLPNDINRSKEQDLENSKKQEKIDESIEKLSRTLF
jgi:hypothetical protein